MTIHIEDLKLQCIIGILDFERVTPQDVTINITIDYNYENNFLNYAEIVQLVKEIMIKSEFFLIEEALDKLNLKLIKEYSSIKSMFIKITKPSILPDCKVSVSNNYKSQS
ncbi:dihydroneopterin aldolase [Sulfurimonas sp.]|uniref:dihydroneopterin aldolase n=1 Tax=Sulfurimonas sp. TaxID=2022749 RepID=UPI003562C690